MRALYYYGYFMCPALTVFRSRVSSEATFSCLIFQLRSIFAKVDFKKANLNFIDRIEYISVAHIADNYRTYYHMFSSAQQVLGHNQFYTYIIRSSISRNSLEGRLRYYISKWNNLKFCPRSEESFFLRCLSNSRALLKNANF